MRTREKILTTATDLYVNGGNTAVTMRGIGERIGLSPMAVYRHFDNRDALLFAIEGQAHRVFLGYLKEALQETTPLARLRASGRCYVRFALEQPHLYERLFAANLDPEPCRPAWQESETFQFLVQRVQECIVDQQKPAQVATNIALAVWGHVHGMVSLHLAGRLTQDDASFYNLYEQSSVLLEALVRS